MIKPELVQEIANKTKLSKKKIELVIDTMTIVIGKEVGKGDKVLISGFGAFYSAHRKARNGINPITKEPMQIKDMLLPKFRPGEQFKRAVKNKR